MADNDSDSIPILHPVYDTAACKHAVFLPAARHILHLYATALQHRGVPPGTPWEDAQFMAAFLALPHAVHPLLHPRMAAKLMGLAVKRLETGTH